MDINEIVKLRKVGKLEEALLRMKEIYLNNPENPEYNYQLAWCNDVLGNEREAIPLYKRAIDLGIENSWRMFI
ncbi:tetratricopeptide repeat protein [Ignavigranum ruoffiae]|uniref:tetratricopeptide repeat protein n=1 Tax=Ignavigranum ruoffiae TaxID=89093 RepID=UPI0024AE0CD5|nr:tetratricopeptide repeat protein [Ignavigranum ruoffiae]